MGSWCAPHENAHDLSALLGRGAPAEDRMLAVFWGLAAIEPVGLHAKDEPAVTVTRVGHGLYQTHAPALVHATHETIWEILTDYGNFAQFIPGLNASRVLSRGAARCTVEQRWRATPLLIPFLVDITVLSIERPLSNLDVHLVRGDLKSLEGGYSIQEGPDGQTSILRDGRVENATLLPDLISTALVRRQAQLQFVGIIREIQRRAAQRARVVTLAPAP
ncbi:MAG TPA: SRPBCC family protein [Burkholderiaceae bacterium]|nr:SRPBCC family protein [Burkholderiaceae bacterium]